MVIIGITGTLGAGKGTIVEYLVSQKGFKHLSARAFLIEEMEKRGLENNRDNMVLVGNDLREKNNSSSFIADELFKKALKSGQNCIIESLRTAGEIESLRKKGNFILLAVNADPKVRYERVTQRLASTDYVSFEKFLSDEEREMASTDPNKQNLKKCIAMADYTILNTKDFVFLEDQIKEVLNEISVDRG